MLSDFTEFEQVRIWGTMFPNFNLLDQDASAACTGGFPWSRLSVLPSVAGVQAAATCLAKITCLLSMMIQHLNVFAVRQDVMIMKSFNLAHVRSPAAGSQAAPDCTRIDISKKVLYIS